MWLDRHIYRIYGHRPQPIASPMPHHTNEIYWNRKGWAGRPGRGFDTKSTAAVATINRHTNIQTNPAKGMDM